MFQENVRYADAVQEYLDVQAATKVYSTVREYGYKLRGFQNDTGIKYLSELSPRLVGEYFVSKRHFSASHYNMTRSTLKGFFEWCQLMEYMPATPNLLALVAGKKETERDWLHVPQEHWPELLEIADAISPLHRWIIALGLYTFMRESEMELLRADDVIFGYTNDHTRVPLHFRIHVVKSKKVDNSFPISTELAAEYERWMAFYRASAPKILHGNPHLVPARHVHHGKAQFLPERCASHIGRMVKDVLELAGYENLNGEGAHTLRRSGANAFHNAMLDEGLGAEARLICKEILHHASLKTTERYLRTSRDKELRDTQITGRAMFKNTQPLAEAEIIPLHVVGA